MKMRTIAAFGAGLLAGLVCGLVLALWAVSAGLIMVYESDPNRRMEEFLNNSEEFRKLEDEWERIWFEDEAKKNKVLPKQPK